MRDVVFAVLYLGVFGVLYLGGMTAFLYPFKGEEILKLLKGGVTIEDAGELLKLLWHSYTRGNGIFFLFVSFYLYVPVVRIFTELILYPVRRVLYTEEMKIFEEEGQRQSEELMREAKKLYEMLSKLPPEEREALKKRIEEKVRQAYDKGFYDGSGNRS